MRAINSILIVCISLFGLLAGCKIDDQTDSETHWQRALHACDVDEDCRNGLSCLCGMCTTTCSADATVCDELSGSAVCVSDEASTEALCGTDGSAPESICASDCTNATDCPDEQACVSGYCTPTESSTPGPDGGDADVDGGDTRFSEHDFCGEPGNASCCPEEYFNALGSSGWTTDMFFPLLERTGDVSESDQLTVTYDGVTDESAVQTSCPYRATELNLACEVDYAMSFDGGDTKLFVGLPRQELEALANSGDTLTLEWSSYRRDNKRMRDLRLTNANGDVLLDVGHTLGSNLDGGAPETIDRPGYTVRIDELAEDRSNAVCLTERDVCDRFVAVQSLLIDHGGTTDSFGPYSQQTLQLDGATYRVRHVTSFQRIYVDGSCSNETPVRMNYVLTPDAASN